MNMEPLHLYVKIQIYIQIYKVNSNEIYLCDENEIF